MLVLSVPLDSFALGGSYSHRLKDMNAGIELKAPVTLAVAEAIRRLERVSDQERPNLL